MGRPRVATALAGVPTAGRRTLAGLLAVSVVCTLCAVPLVVDLVGLVGTPQPDLQPVVWPLVALLGSLVPSGIGTLLVVLGRRRAHLAAGWALLVASCALAAAPLVG